MDKIILPYRSWKALPPDDRIYYERFSLDGKCHGWIVYDVLWPGEYGIHGKALIQGSTYSSLEEAMSILDASLIDEGYTILSEEQANKYRVLI